MTLLDAICIQRHKNIENEIDKLTEEIKDISKFLNQDGLTFEDRKPKYDRLVEITNELSKLDSLNKEMLMEEMNLFLSNKN